MKKTIWWGGHQLNHGGGKSSIGSSILREAKLGTIGFKLMRIKVEDQTLYM